MRNRISFIGLLLLTGMVGGAVWVGAQGGGSKAGDFNQNGRIDSDDLFDFAYYFGLGKGDPLYETEGYQADFDGNGRVDEMDLFDFSSRWHQD